MMQTHQSDPRILNRRTVERDHRGLVEHLRPGMQVLDAGCGTGSITAGIARLIGPEGTATGVDRDASLLEIAQREHGAVPGLRFAQQDLLQLPYVSQFDLVTAARVVQWIAEPPAALGGMRKAAKAGGVVVVLDYNHVENRWFPEPPEAFGRFYAAFLEWRAANGWRNRMATELPELFREAGIEVLRIENSDEVAVRGEAGFAGAVGMWAEVAESLGPKIVEAGYLTEERRQEAVEAYRGWAAEGLERQALCLRTVSGVARS
ncbi:MAG: methyltransferase domain-containing protein [Bryobacterales bacterium]|nr:methyltransferase domain-containing protein [Bryobacterales bacterium]